MKEVIKYITELMDLFVFSAIVGMGLTSGTLTMFYIYNLIYQFNH